jgi:lipopolysaccharide/colanic/teichoic acid biosynthesis glycosyltransferase
MSLIGPRPERPEFVEAFNETIPFYAKRHLIKPGLTGWAQVHEGYSGSEMETIRKVERDLYYLKHQSISLDLRIVAATVSSVLSLRGR